MIENSRNELDEFKRRINLVEFAASFGYRIIKSKSSRNFKTMSKGKGQPSIVVYTAQDGHGLYFERGIDGVKTVIDMCQDELGFNLGKVRQYLRKWSGYADIRNFEEYKKPQIAELDLIKVRREISMMAKVEPNNAYLKSRFISEKIITDERFLILKDKSSHGNITFIHTDVNGEICGYEQKNKGFTYFSEGGHKGLWLSRNVKKAETIVICESAVDALSHAQIFKTSNDIAYASIAGQISEAQVECMKRWCGAKKVVIATDNDKSGEEYFEKIKAVLGNISTYIGREKPTKKDWNDDLKYGAEQALSLGYELELR